MGASCWVQGVLGTWAAQPKIWSTMNPLYSWTVGIIVAGSLTAAAVEVAADEPAPKGPAVSAMQSELSGLLSTQHQLDAALEAQKAGRPVTAPAAAAAVIEAPIAKVTPTTTAGRSTTTWIGSPTTSTTVAPPTAPPSTTTTAPPTTTTTKPPTTTTTTRPHEDD